MRPDVCGDAADSARNIHSPPYSEIYFAARKAEPFCILRKHLVNLSVKEEISRSLRK